MALNDSCQLNLSLVKISIYTKIWWGGGLSPIASAATGMHARVTRLLQEYKPIYRTHYNYNI